MKPFLLLLISLLSTGAVHAQPTPEETYTRRIAEDFIAEYNRQDYDAMYRRLSLPFKVLVGKKDWTALWAGKWTEDGRITTPPRAILVSGLRAVIPLQHGGDTVARGTVEMAVNSKGVIQGLLISPDPYNIVAGPTPAAGLESAVDSILAKSYPQGFSGTVAYAVGDRLVFQKTVGLADPRTETELNDSSVFELASVSKQFTAAAILKLQEMGDLSVEDSVQKFFPELRAYKGVKVRHLIHHTAGLPPYEGYLASGKVKKPFVYNADVVQWLADREASTDSPPGSRYRYSNTGYAVLAAIVEKASGMTYGEFLNRQFFTPLGMRHSQVYTRRAAGDTLGNYAYGYVWNEKSKTYVLPDGVKSSRFVVKLDGVVGDGGVATTAADLAKWAAAMTRPGAVLSAASIRAISTPDTLTGGRVNNYGYGVEIRRRPVGLILGHNGGWPGYETLLYRFPERGEALIILCNRVHPEQNMGKAAQELAGLFLGR